MARSELQSSSFYNDSTQVQMLSETAVNVVIGQIRDASDDANSLWVSQPGGIRQYNQEGDFTHGFKLYSDDEMVVVDDESRFALADASDLENWQSDDLLWTDLNEPVIRGTTAHFPIADPAAKLVQGIEGFDFDLSDIPRGEFQAAVVENVKLEGGAQPTTLPMPVKWLYVLKDGSIGTLDENHRFVGADGNPIDSMTARKNPIQGRIAFWADDETSKVNINTASEPVFWDTPRVAGGGPVKQGYNWEVLGASTEFDDRKYGWSQPTVTEYQRFPGHPAQTALSPILFPNVDPLLPEHFETIYNLVPKIEWGGSEAATRPYLDVEPLILDKNYLFPSVDELVMSIQRPPKGRGTLSRSETQLEVKGDSIDPAPVNEVIEQSRFFLTANSRAPETNVFNQPRISIWPTSFEEKTSKGQHRTVFDNLLRFCSTTGQKGVNEAPYYFQRQNADSATDDWEKIRRNQELMSYLQRLTTEKIPGFGGRFSTKYDEDRDQILTEIFDYIRCTNLYDENLDKFEYSLAEWQGGRKQSQFTDGRAPKPKVKPGEDGKEMINKESGSFPGHGQVVPIEIQSMNTRGIGRFYTIPEVGIMFICNADAGGEHPKVPGEPEFPDGVLGSNVVGDQVGQNAALTRKLDWQQEERSIQAALLFELFTPSQGWTPLDEDITIKVEILEPFKINGEVVEFNIGDDVWQSGGASAIANVGKSPGNSTAGGTVGFWSLANNRLVPARGPLPDDRNIEGDKKERTDERRLVYPYISVPLIIGKSPEKMSFTGGRLTIRIYQGNAHSPDPRPLEARPLVQSLEVKFEDTDLPRPELMRKYGPQAAVRAKKDETGGFIMTLPRSRNRDGNLVNRRGGVYHPSYWWVFNRNGIKVGDPEHDHKNWGNWNTDPNKAFETLGFSHAGRFKNFGNPGWTIVNNTDVVRSMVLRHSDYRLLSATGQVASDNFVSHPVYHESNRFVAHSFTGLSGNSVPGHYQNAAPLLPELRGKKNANRYRPEKKPDFPDTEAALTFAVNGDFDNGVSVTRDGPYINKPDEGNGLQKKILVEERDAGSFRSNIYKWSVPYFDEGSNNQALIGASYFSPNRMVPSPVMFGSLPTGVKRDLPWQTLLFRPQEGHPGDAVPTDLRHRGQTAPPDHLLLDLFWMPVVEPYAISEPFSTAGKINLNYQMLPFSHITRSTAIRAVMKSEWMLAVPTNMASFYKDQVLPQRIHVRHPINMDETLRQFRERFDQGLVFKTASEVCDLHLVPQTNRNTGSRGSGKWVSQSKTKPPTLEDMRNDFWEKHAPTGDNSRERPYANIYPRLTTKSNTYRVHYRCQLIRQGKASTPGTFNPATDGIMADYRGSTLVERYLEPGDDKIPDFATLSSGSASEEETLQKFYQFRIINSRRFAP